MSWQFTKKIPSPNPLRANKDILTIPFSQSNENKILTHFTKHVQDLNANNCIMLMKNIKEELCKWQDVLLQIGRLNKDANSPQPDW